MPRGSGLLSRSRTWALGCSSIRRRKLVGAHEAWEPGFVCSTERADIKIATPRDLELIPARLPEQSGRDIGHCRLPKQPIRARRGDGQDIPSLVLAEEEADRVCGGAIDARPGRASDRH